MAEALRSEGFEIKIETNGESGEDEALTNVYDLIILDVMLPKKNGFDILKEVHRNKINAPILMVTAKSELEDKLKGLENGADDYITKPFHIQELIARVKLSVKRNNNIEDTSLLKFEDITLNLNSGIISKDDKKIQLNGKELNLMELLMINKNQVLNRETIAEKVWGILSDAEYNNVEVYISFIRKKMEFLKVKTVIRTARGIGYSLEEKETGAVL
jgi:DNA-binding response OmpR family regulator